jgi:hypothetical protein
MRIVLVYLGQKWDIVYLEDWLDNQFLNKSHLFASDST